MMGGGMAMMGGAPMMGGKQGHGHKGGMKGQGAGYPCMMMPPPEVSN